MGFEYAFPRNRGNEGTSFLSGIGYTNDEKNSAIN